MAVSAQEHHYYKGARVFHRTNGYGVITKIISDEEYSSFTIDFDNGTQKTLKATYNWGLAEVTGSEAPKPQAQVITTQEEPMAVVEKIQELRCTLCGYTSEDLDENSRWCERCMMLSASIGIAVLATKNSNNLPRLWSLVRSVVKCPPDEFALELDNCGYCHQLIVMRPIDFKLRTSPDSYCSRECKAAAKKG